MPLKPLNLVDIQDWRGLYSNRGRFPAEPSFASTQSNLTISKQGELRSRRQPEQICNLGKNCVSLGNYRVSSTDYIMGQDTSGVVYAITTTALQVTNAFSTAPCSYAVGTNGVLYMANGAGAVKRWAGGTEVVDDVTLASDVLSAGISAPTAEVTAAGTGEDGGTLTGAYRAYCRYYNTSTGLGGSFSPLGTAFTLNKATGVSYTGVPAYGAGTDTDFVIQIWRNTHGQGITYYLDTTVSNGEGALSGSSTKTDAQLRASSSMRLLTSDGYPNAHRFGVPPTDMPVVVNYQDRLWFTGSTSAADRATIVFSEPGEPESVPSANAIVMQDDGDQIVGLMPYGPYLYVLKRHHIYRLTTAGDPRRDASATLVANRGCLSQRCWCQTETTCFLMDSDGLWVFDGSGATPIDEPVRDYITGRVDWSHYATFSVSSDSQEQSVRFFVALDTDSTPEHALVFHYGQKAWWLEDYGASIRCSGSSEVSGIRRCIISTGLAVSYLNQGTYQTSGEESSTSVSFEITLGEFKVLPTSRINERRFELYYNPLTATGTYGATRAHVHVRVYYDGSATAENAVVGHENDTNVTAAVDSPDYTIDLTDTSGYASFTLNDGMARDTQAPRTVTFKLYGAAYQDMTFNEIVISGVQ